MTLMFNSDLPPDKLPSKIMLVNFLLFNSPLKDRDQYLQFIFSHKMAMIIDLTEHPMPFFTRPDRQSDRILFPMNAKDKILLRIRQVQVLYGKVQHHISLRGKIRGTSQCNKAQRTILPLGRTRGQIRLLSKVHTYLSLIGRDLRQIHRCRH